MSRQTSQKDIKYSKTMVTKLNENLSNHDISQSHSNTSIINQSDIRDASRYSMISNPITITDNNNSELDTNTQYHKHTNQDDILINNLGNSNSNKYKYNNNNYNND